METASDVVSDAADSPSRNADLHNRTKRPDKQLYVPRQKREEFSEPDSPSRNFNTDENVNSNSTQQKSSKPKTQSANSRRQDEDSLQRPREGNHRKARDYSGNESQNSSSNFPKGPRKTANNNAVSADADQSEFGQFVSVERSQRPKRPATSGGQNSSSSTSRIFHNSAGGSRRPVAQQQSCDVKLRSSQQRQGQRYQGGWNGEGDEYHDEGDYYDEYSSYSGGYSSSRYNNNNNNSEYQQRRPRRNGPNPSRPLTTMSITEQTKAAEAIAAQLPDLLSPMPQPLSMSRQQTTSGSQPQPRSKNQSSRRDNQQSLYSSDKSFPSKGRSGGSGSGRSNDFSYEQSESTQQKKSQVHENVFEHEEEPAHGHRGGLLFVSQASLHQQGHAADEHNHQQVSPFPRSQPVQIEDTHYPSQLMLAEIEHAEVSVLNLFNNSGLNFEYISPQLGRLRHMYFTSVLSDATYALENNRDQAMWNGVFYKLYSGLRYNLLELRQTRFAPSIVALVDETVRFYEDLCDKLADKYSVNVENSVVEAKKIGEKKSTKCARLLLQRLYISLGDLFRYRCSAMGAIADADIAQKYYERAQKLAPKNSHPFNQMAVLALMTKRRLDAVYYFSRALAASNPILSVSENLMAIFNDACRRSEATQTCDEEAERNRRQSLSVGVDSRRSEVWISSDGRRTVMSGAPSSELDDVRYSAVVQRLPLSQLTQRLMDSVLNVHGRIFSKVGLDSMPDAVSRCLWELEAALSIDLALLTPVRLTHLTLLNFFAVWKSSVDSSNKSVGAKSLAEIFAVEFVLDCAALIIRHARAIFTEKKMDALRRLMPCVKLYADWLMYNRTLWHPPPCALDPMVCPEDLDLFAQIAGFANATANYDVSDAAEVDPRQAPVIGEEVQNMALPVRLEEDELIAGFAPFAKIRSVSYETRPGIDPANASFAARLQRFRTLTDYLCGIESPVLEFNVDGNSYTSLVSSVCRSEKQTAKPATLATNVPAGALPPPLFDFPPQRNQQTSQGGSAVVESELDAMRRRRRDLVAEAERKRADEEYRRELLMREEQQGVAAGSIVMEVRPLVLVIDTNSIVDYIPAIRRIVECNKFTVVLPLVVISELNSLSSGPRQSGKFLLGNNSDEDRGEEHVPSAAAEALSFFEGQFNRRNNRIKAMTSDGSILDTIAFRDQMPTTATSNDDAILACALHYCKMMENLDRQAAMNAAAGGSGAVITREVVLVTCDRNLRIKAHLNRVPTCPMRTLLKWARIPATGSSSGH